MTSDGDRSDWRAAWAERLDRLPPAARWLILAGLTATGLGLLVMVASLAAAGAFLHGAPRFPRPPYRQPSRLYGQPTHLAVGATYEAGLLADELAAEGYRELPPAKGAGREASDEIPPGAYRRGAGSLAVHLRHSAGATTTSGAAVEATFDGDRVRGLAVAGRPVAQLDLPPPLLASYYGPELEERVPVTLDELPKHVVRAVLAAEDAGFYRHPGVSIAGIVRAAWVDLSGGAVEQGGSTLTQQLVKNLYLTQKRTLSRKAREVLLALVVEARHGKREILEAYLNEIYWGRSGPANLIGLGAAARAYFGKDAADLSLAEAATLAGMIRAPGEYSPREHPERAIDRRNFVLRRMADLGWAPRERVLAAAGEPLPPPAPPLATRRIAPYFADAAEAEAAERFGVKTLADRGYRLSSTLRFRDQRQAEEAVAHGLEELAKGPERHGGGSLQAALVSTDPRDGAILAYVGGRDYARSQFDRVSQARRPAGSAWKPVVYAAAFADGVAAPATYLEDSPIVVRYGAERWSPQDYDRTYKGWVTARAALEQSLNVPAVRVALSTGLPRVIELAHSMGIEARLDPMPSLALGAFAVTPMEMATVYSTLADDGSRPALHGLAAVVDAAGDEVSGEPLPAPRRVLEPQAAYLVTSVLMGVLDRGTGQAARREGVQGGLAGKTGTTNGRRDNWFAGYSPDRATVVWVGYDDDATSHLSGSSAALPIWSRFTAAVRPPGGYPDFQPPPGLVTATVDPTTGQLATPACPVAVTDLFTEWRVPREPCSQHLAAGADAWRAAQLDPADPNADPALTPASPAAPGAGGGVWSQRLRNVEVAPASAEAAPRQPAMRAPVHPLPPAADQDGAGTILIRPTVHPQPPASDPATDGGEASPDDSADPPADPPPPPPPPA